MDEYISGTAGFEEDAHMIALASDHTGIEMKKEIMKLLDEMGLTY